MANVLVERVSLEDIADAIRAKNGTITTYKPYQMPTAIANINTEAHLPITVNITQSEHQTITVTAVNPFGSKTSSGTYSLPNTVTINAAVTPDSGYNAGTLNQTSIAVPWGGSVSFSATAATEIPMVNFSIAFVVDPVECESEFTGSNALTIPIAGTSFTLIPGDTVTHAIRQGEEYNTAIPIITNYIANPERLSGVLTTDTSVTLTLTKYTGRISISCTYIDGTAASCSYTGTIGEQSVSGNVLGTATTNYYTYGTQYSLSFSDFPQGYTASIYNNSGTINGRNQVTIILMPNSVPVEINPEDYPGGL